MDSIRLLKNLSLLSSRSLRLDSSESTDQTLLKKAQEAVLQENKLAALDYSVLSGSQFSKAGAFSFAWTRHGDGSGTLSISYENPAASADATAKVEVASNFSLRISISADGAVHLPNDIQATQEQLQGTDFTYDKSGVLELKSGLAERMGAQGGVKVDLGGKLDDDALALLKRLGLLDEDGKATQLLQLLSDYAGLDRFKAGQQVSGGAETRYGMSEKALRLQRQMLQSIKSRAALA